MSITYDDFVNALKIVSPNGKVVLFVPESLLKDAVAIVDSYLSSPRNPNECVLPSVSVKVNNLLPSGEWYMTVGISTH